ncbi:MAG TPA: amidohydrolase, partial [Thermoanaerobaculia bacterium]
MSRIGRASALALLISIPAALAAETVAITGATVHTLGKAGTIEGATVLIENGRIRAVGKDVAVPSSARRIDAAGKVVTPGFFDSLSHLGIVEVNAVPGTRDTASNDPR